MSVLESSFDVLIQKTAELMEELRLTREQLEIRTQDLISLRLERSREDPHVMGLEEVEEENEHEVANRMDDIGER